MRKANKKACSRVLAENLKYGVRSVNKRIEEILTEEQNNFCAYTDEYMTITDAKEIEHFDPTLKSTEQDSYSNWFLVKAKWNRQKAAKWTKFQPILHPSSDDLENRIVYSEGDYILSDSDDLEAENLIKLLNLDNPSLAMKRKKYLARKRQEIELYGVSPEDFFKILFEQDASSIMYSRAIREEFNVDIFQLIIAQR